MLRGFVVVLSVVGALLVAGPQPAEGHAAATRLTASEDPVAAAVELSRATFPDGGADRVVIGRNDVFADTLAGASLAGTKGPVLYVPGGPSGRLPETVENEIRRVLGAPLGDCRRRTFADIYLLGGTQAVSAEIERQLTELAWCVNRLSGASRVQTAVRVADEVAYRAGVAGGSAQVLLARADDWADAATGSAWAAFASTPILVTPRDQLHADVADWLSRQRRSDGSTDIVLLGGTGALNENVRTAAAAHGTVRRVFGPARDATAAEIAEQLWGARAEGGVLLVNGYTSNGWVYALAGAVNAARMRTPELYVQATAIPPGTAAYLDRRPPPFVAAAGPASAIGEDVVATVARTPHAVFIHTAASPVGNSAFLDHPLTNDNPGAALFVTANWNPPGSTPTYNDSPIGVWFSRSDGRWAIFNQDRAAMPTGASFNIELARQGYWVRLHEATTGNSDGNFTYLDHPWANGNPDAVIMVTPVWNPPGSEGVYNDAPIGVFYDSGAGKWAIFNQDRSPMPAGAAFNVEYLPPSLDVFVHKATTATISANYTYLDHPILNGNPAATVLVTPNWNPSGVGGVYVDAPIGVFYDSGPGKWAVFTQDRSPMPEGAAFNVHAPQL